MFTNFSPHTFFKLKETQLADVSLHHAAPQAEKWGMWACCLRAVSETQQRNFCLWNFHGTGAFLTCLALQCSQDTKNINLEKWLKVWKCSLAVRKMPRTKFKVCHIQWKYLVWRQQTPHHLFNYKHVIIFWVKELFLLETFCKNLYSESFGNM